MSPEQCLGQVVTSASGIYSLGCLFLELLTGDPPFLATADTPLRSHHLNTSRTRPLCVGLDHRWFPAILPISLTSCFCGLLLLRFGF
jgi:serine/threonine protein kinase